MGFSSAFKGLIINGSVPPIEHTSTWLAMGRVYLYYKTPVISAKNIIVKENI